MKKCVAGLFAAVLLVMMLPSKADAAVRLGADVIWMPVASSSVSGGNVEVDSNHKLASFGAAAHGGLGFDIFSVNLKLNYFNQGLDIAADNDVRKDQLDINAMLRFGIPTVGLGIFGEAGGSMSLDYDGFGYNAGVGVEYAVVSPPMLDLNVGMMGQYVNVPQSINDNSTDLESFRGMLFVGVDFGF